MKKLEKEDFRLRRAVSDLALGSLHRLWLGAMPLIMPLLLQIAWVCRR